MPNPPRVLLAAALLLPAAGLLLVTAPAVTAPDHHEKDGDDKELVSGLYRKATIDVGVIVSDVHAAEEFYEDALGFEEVDEFDVSAEVATASGLTDGHGFTADVMALGFGEDATRIKLIEIPKAPGARPDNRFVHSTYGPSYLTVHVLDMDEALAKAAEEGVKPIAEGPTKVGGETFIALIRDPDGNFIELVGPRPNSTQERLEDAADEVGDAAEAVGDAIDDAVDGDN